MSATIAARARSGSTLTAPIKRAAPPRRKAPWLSRIWRAVGRRPGRAFVLLVFTAVAAAILANAMLLQKVRHPAPILSAPMQGPYARSVERRTETPPAAVTPAAQPASASTQGFVPPARPSDLTQLIRETTQPRPPAAVTNVPRTAPATAAHAPAPVTRSAAMRDPIADLINGGDIRPPADIRGAKPSQR
ncbi:hypothetical protein [Bosea psychrotolerans]|uniref:Uncharacterized protein n=1 Tax=Bosea psychrotolerans TaxID=1871628 RepID=A0A2S4M041_9HYPH|nr:hypothetical protein [Bosea psychrotolerans]POR48028.1 hypothetical protein CYD53_11651 [Bosea psychrotolerans]